MRTIETKLYTFSELSDSAKEAAIDSVRHNASDEDFHMMYREFIDSMREFCTLTGVELSNYELGYNSSVSLNLYLDNCELTDLNGLRLRTWLVNNWLNSINNRKYLKTLSYVPKFPSPFVVIVHKKHDGGKFSQVYSRVQKSGIDDYSLTGVYSDYAVLKPIIEFVKNPAKFPATYDLADLLSDIASSIESTVTDCYENINSDEYITETIKANEYEFLESGDIH